MLNPFSPKKPKSDQFMTIAGEQVEIPVPTAPVKYQEPQQIQKAPEPLPQFQQVQQPQAPQQHEVSVEDILRDIYDKLAEMDNKLTELNIDLLKNKQSVLRLESYQK